MSTTPLLIVSKSAQLLKVVKSGDPGTVSALTWGMLAYMAGGEHRGYEYYKVERGGREREKGTEGETDRQRQTGRQTGEETEVNDKAACCMNMV